MRYPRSFAIGIAFAVTIPLAACSATVTTPPPASTSTEAPAGEKPAPATDEAAPAKAAPAKARTTEKPKTTKPKPKTTKPATSDLSGLRITDIRAGKSILLDVADDDEDRYLQVGDNGQVGFTGTSRTDTTMMSLHAAPVAADNRVVIKPPFWNEDLGDGYCVASAPKSALKLEVCKPGKASQIWRVQLAGDSGLFELHGTNGIMKSAGGRTALQVLPYAE
jgi:hypothetical protein